MIRWFWSNVGTITSEESVRVLADGVEIGTLEGAYAERLQAGDRFVLDGRALEFRRLEGLIVHARAADGEPSLPRWSSDRQALSAELALDLARFREEAAPAPDRRPLGPPRLAPRGARPRARRGRRPGPPVRGPGAGQRGPRAGNAAGRGVAA